MQETKKQIDQHVCDAEIIVHCPQCGSDEWEHDHTGPAYFQLEADFKRCVKCGFDWDHE